MTLICLDGVTDPRNIGSLLRSAASFNIDGVIIKERNFPSESKLLYKAASGAIEYINIFEVSNILFVVSDKAAIIAPTIITEDIAFVTDIRGVCNEGVTLQTT